MASLVDKTALVTGASRGIGRATALALAKAGARVIVHYGRSAVEAETLVAEIRAAGGSADVAQAELSTPDGAAALAKQVRAIVGQRLDIFVSNAGVSKAAAIEDHTIEDFDNLFATNVRSPFFLVKELLPLFREGSSIVVVSSLAARGAPGNPGQPGAPSLPAYAATKGALETLVKHWAVAARAARHPCQCRRSGSDRNGHVPFHEDRGGPRLHTRHAGAEAHRAAVGCGRRDCVSGL